MAKKHKTRKKQRTKSRGDSPIAQETTKANAADAHGFWSKTNAFEWMRSILIAVGLALLIRWPVVEPYKIPSGSMEPTFVSGDRIFVNKYVYGVRFPLNGFRIPFTSKSLWYADRRVFYAQEPQRWDIAVFKAVEPGVDKDILVKRIVGLPGERVHIANGQVYVNGEALELPDFMPDVKYTTPRDTFSPIRYGISEEDEYSLIPEGHFFLLGDNSDHSRDGRWWGWVPNHHLLGRVSSIWWPPSRGRDLTGFTDTAWWKGSMGLLVAMIFLRLFIGRSWRVYGESPAPGIRAGQHLIVNRISFGLPLPFTYRKLTGGRRLRRGEVVLYRPGEEGADGRELLLGRVAGLPGEKVFLQDGALQINDRPVTAPASLAKARFEGTPGGAPYGRSKGRQHSVVPENHYFVLAEDLTNTVDSREVGWIGMKNVVGTATFVWWPIWRGGRVSTALEKR